MKKTLVTLLAVALVASLCGMMFVSAESTNLAAGKEVANAENVPEEVTTFWIDANLTDGVAQADWELDWAPGEWLGFWWNAEAENALDKSNADDGIAIPTIDLGEVCTIESARINMFLGNQMGIVPASSVALQVSDDGETFTTVASVELTAPETEDTTVGWVELTPESAATGRYVRIEMALKGYWLFIDEIEVYGTAAGSDDEPDAPVSFDFEKEITAVDGTAIDDGDVNGQVYFYPGEADAERVVDSEQYNLRYSYIMICDAEGTIIEVGNNLVFASKDTSYQNEITIPAGGHAISFYYNADNPANEDLYNLYMDALTKGYPTTEVYNETVTLLETSHKIVLEDDKLVVNNGVVEEEPSEEPSEAPSEEPESSEPPKTGDAGVLVFAVLAVVAIAGCAVAVKARG